MAVSVVIGCQSAGSNHSAEQPSSPALAAPLGETAAARHVVVASMPSDDEPLAAVPKVDEIFESLELDAKPQRIELGRALFHDPRLSQDNTVSCATCHDLRFGGVDHFRTAVGIRGQVGPINTPTVFNAVLSVAQFWDGRAATLKDQAAGPPQAAGEMGSHFDEITDKLRQDKRYSAAFAAAFPDEVHSEADITKARILEAIATYEVTLVTPNSRFDRWLGGEAGVLNQDELTGYALFKQIGCSSCHYGPSVGGKAYQRMGQKHDFFSDRVPTTADLGRYNVTKNNNDRYTFKVPNLRNVELTAPYLHDGSLNTLEEVVRTMAHYQLDENLNDTEVKQIAAFLRTLTGTFEGRPLQNH